MDQHRNLAHLVTPEGLTPIKGPDGVVRWAGSRPADEPDQPADLLYPSKECKGYAERRLRNLYEVDRLTRLGLTARQIGYQLGITKRTVARYRTYNQTHPPIEPDPDLYEQDEDRKGAS